jgi:predicted acylesterase/phospholipase RssA
MKNAVFASMSIPPLFPYMKFKMDMVEWFEDGGVVDNLPMWFGTQIEECDLLFVLPLNASFAEPVNRRSITKRIFRVMDVRQGMLERNSFKLAYLYNELAELRKVVEKQGIAKNVETARAMKREHDPVSIFAICAGRPLLINTTEFWKPDEAGKAFDLMYTETKYELQDHFKEDTDPHCIRMTVVSSLGERSQVEDF